MYLTKFFIILLLFLSILRPSTSHALYYFEKLSANIVKVSPNKKAIIVNRGREDGVNPEMVARFYIKGKFLCEAVVIVSQTNLSEWIIHRIYNSEFLEGNLDVLVINPYGSKKIPIKNFAHFALNSYLIRIQEEEDAKRLALQKEEEEKAIKLLDKKYELETYEEFKVPDFNLALEISPFIFRSPHRERNIGYGIELDNINQEKYLFSFVYNYSSYQYHDLGLGKTHSYGRNFGEGKYELKNIKEHLDYATLVRFKRERDGQIEVISSQVNIGPAGLKYRFPKKTKRTKLDISYIPLFEIYSGDQVYITGQSTFRYKNIQESYFRHFLAIEYEYQFLPNFTFNNLFEYSPKFTELSNAELLEQITLSYVIYPNWNVSVKSRFSNDNRRKLNLGESSSQWENGLFFNYNGQIKDFSF